MNKFPIDNPNVFYFIENKFDLNDDKRGSFVFNRGNGSKYNMNLVSDRINESQEKIKTSELYGYLGHPKSGELFPDQSINFASNFTRSLTLEGTQVSHTEQVINNKPGIAEIAYHQANIGGYSWAGEGMKKLLPGGGRECHLKKLRGFDYDLHRNYLPVENRGYFKNIKTGEILESSKINESVEDGISEKESFELFQESLHTLNESLKNPILDKDDLSLIIESSKVITQPMYIDYVAKLKDDYRKQIDEKDDFILQLNLQKEEEITKINESHEKEVYELQSKITELEKETSENESIKESTEKETAEKREQFLKEFNELPILLEESVLESLMTGSNYNIKESVKLISQLSDIDLSDFKLMNSSKEYIEADFSPINESNDSLDFRNIKRMIYNQRR